MSNYQLSKIQALKLLTPVVDGEASEAERKAFMEFIAQNEEVRNKYHTMKKLKSLVSERCPRTKAPDSLRNKVNDFLQEVKEDESHPQIDPPIYDIPCSGPGTLAGRNITPPDNNSKPRYWLLSSAATMLVILALGGFFNVSNLSKEFSSGNIAEKMHEYISGPNGQETTISTASLGSSDLYLSPGDNLSIIEPEVHNHEFKVVVLEELNTNSQASIINYHLESENQ